MSRVQHRLPIARVHLVATAILLLCSLGATAQETDLLETWSEVLQYGIDSEVQTVVDQIEQAGERSLDEKIAARFDRTRDTDAKVRIVEYFTNVESPELADTVRSVLLSDERLPDDLLRVCAAYMSRVVDDRSEDLLERYVRIAKDTDVLAGSVAIGAIGRNGTDAAVEALIDLYDRVGSTDLRAAVLRALGETGSELALPRLTSVAEDEFEESSLRQNAAQALGKIGAPESLDLLKLLLGSPDSVLRAYATGALGNYGPDETGETLEQALLDSFWRVRVTAIDALAQQGRVQAVPAIEYKARRDPERPVRQAAMKALATLGGDDARSVLQELVTDTKLANADRVVALQQLATLDRATSVASFLSVIDAEWSRDSSPLLDTIGRYVSTNADPVYAPVYDKLLTHPNYIIRMYAIRGIGAAGLSGQGETLKQIARENAGGLVGRTAIAALEQLGIAFDPETEAPADE